MSDLLLIVPESWTEIPNDPEWIGSVVTVADLTYMVSEEAWGDIEGVLRSMVVMPDGQRVTSARLVATDTGYRFWVEYGI